MNMLAEAGAALGMKQMAIVIKEVAEVAMASFAIEKRTVAVDGYQVSQFAWASLRINHSVTNSMVPWNVVHIRLQAPQGSVIIDPIRLQPLHCNHWASCDKSQYFIHKTNDMSRHRKVLSNSLCCLRAFFAATACDTKRSSVHCAELKKRKRNSTSVILVFRPATRCDVY